MAKLRLHIENSRKKAEIFHVTEERWQAACARHRALARKLAVTFGWDGDVLEEALRDAELLIGVPAKRDALAKRAPRLKWVHTTSAGVDGLLPLDWLPRRVPLTNNSGAHGAKAREYMRMAYTLLNVGMPRIIANQHARRWAQLFSPRVAGKSALVIGLGDLGVAAARAAKDLGMHVMGVRRHAQACRYADSVHTYRSLDRLLPRADYVVLAVPLTAETRNILDRRRLALLKPTSGVINIARAPVLDNEALRERLCAGQLAGAVLDVVEPEPLPADSPFWNTPNLIITPHISCDDGADYVGISLDLWFENLARYLDGKALTRRVDPRLGY